MDITSDIISLGGSAFPRVVRHGHLSERKVMIGTPRFGGRSWLVGEELERITGAL